MAENKQLYNLEIHEVLAAFQSSQKGLSSREADQRLQIYGPNTQTVAKVPLWRRVIEPFTSLFVLILLFALVISLFESKWFEAIIIGVIVNVNALIYYFQQFSVSRVLKTLRQQDNIRASVIRDGTTLETHSEGLVPGDVVHVGEGSKVPADGRLIHAEHVQADEALLTGESLLVHKQAGALGGSREVYDQRNMLFKGTYIRSGTGLLLITATGNHTQLGAINELAAEADNGLTPIERKINDVSKKIMIGVGIIGVIIFGLAAIRGIAIEEALRFSLTMIVSAVPEGLPVALTVVLLFSARRMAKYKALVKKISAMETLGAVTFIMTDKTGTITQNKLSVADTFTTHSTPHSFEEVIRLSLNGDGDYTDDPLDGLLLHAVKDITVPHTWSKAKDFPFEQQLRMSATLWQHNHGYTLYVKGAPEQVLHHCKDHPRQSAIKNWLGHFTGRGYRTIALAHRDFSGPPQKLNHETLRNLTFDGFVGLSDQLRPGIAHAVQQAHAAGIKVAMLTGDHVRTAAYIAEQVGIANGPEQVSDSGVLVNGSPEDIQKALQTTTVFGRVLPEHKYALLKATKGSEITAMTGDGVNDIPALVEADAGLAMGSGTDAAKDASDIVLLDDNFNTIMNAIRMGRTVLANIRKMLTYLFATSGGEVLTMMGALFFNMPLPLTPVQILWINLVTDGVTVIPLGLSPPEEHHMKQPPRDPKAPLLSRMLLSRTLVMSIIMAVSVLVLFKLNLDKGLAYAQTMAFLSLIVVQWGNALAVNLEFRSWLYNFARPNGKLAAAIAISVGLNLLIFFTPLSEAFGITSLAWGDALVAILAPAFVSLLVSDIHKGISHLVRRPEPLQPIRTTRSA